jgi:hypothetical protein
MPGIYSKILIRCLKRKQFQLKHPDMVRLVVIAQ